MSRRYAEPQTEEERSELFRLRRRAVQSLVERIEIGQDRKMSVVFRFNALPLLGLNDTDTDGSMASPAGGNYLAGTYTHI